ncbi:hypothetical protein GLOIN_2v1766843 [Rhizophagus clarus]|uniref:Replication origin-binding protein domain-containing protein n=1 Tax=Rhizophagus clarus TaxID=94130 RepID=A0A8H3KQI0_9GLOM|nr:hypothetical protein GLOIN_2v1766843 [Rhizophagus clarus]
MLFAQKKKSPGPGPKTINEATKLFSGLADLNYESGYIDHIYFQYLSNNKNDISLLGAYHPEEIYSKYIVRVAEKGFTVVDHPSEVYGLPDTHECIDGSLPLRLVLDIDARQKPDFMNPELPSLDGYKISREDLLSRILTVCVNIINTDLKHFAILDAFALASSSNSNKCSWHIVYLHARFIDYRDLRSFVEKINNKIRKPYSEFIDIGLYKSRFSLRLLRSAKEDRVKRPAISSVKNSNGCFVLKCYRQKNYKPDHKGLAFGKVIKISAKPKRGIVERIGDAISNPRPLIELSEIMINVEKLKDAPEVYPNFLGIEKMITLIRSPLGIWKTTTLREIIMALKNKVHDLSSLPCHIWVSYRKSLSNESKTKLDELKVSDFRICNYQNIQGDLSMNEWDIIIVQVESLFRIEFTVCPFVAILDEANAIMRQMSSGTNA